MSFNPCPPGHPTWLPGEQLLVSAESIDLKLQLGRTGPTQGPQTFKARVCFFLLWVSWMDGGPC